MASVTTKKITDATRFDSIFISLHIRTDFYENDDYLDKYIISMFLMRIITYFTGQNFM